MNWRRILQVDVGITLAMLFLSQAVSGVAQTIPATQSSRVLLPSTLHLGRVGEPEYDQFSAPATPPLSGPWTLSFVATQNPTEFTLLLRQDDVKETWQVRLNDRRLGNLVAMEAPLVHALTVPPDTLRTGDNTLQLVPPGGVDDILIGPIELHSTPHTPTVHETTVKISVTDRNTGQPIPCRITIVDASGALAPIVSAQAHLLALRAGVVYTGDGHARLGLRAGRYRIHATRGFEYGLDTAKVDLRPGDEQHIPLRIGREVDTRGWVACDTHTHTFTHSRHGDATTEERVITLAGEGIELPIATDHNTLTDYREAARQMGVQAHFTSVIGDEVTTRQAHFNVFPVSPGSRVPDFRIQDWAKLFSNIRATPGVEIVILNHPLNVHNAFQPFHPTNFNRATGEIYQYLAPGFDALELMNSSAQQTDMMSVIHGWFALLNAGHRVTALGTSDGHDVSRYIIGQGRTYLRVDDSDPASIDIADACQALKAGRALVSMGLWADILVGEQFQVGDTVPGTNDEIAVQVTVQGPSWTSVDHIQLFGNGVLLREATVPAISKPGIKMKRTWRLPRPNHDVSLVALATGPGVTNLYWAIPRPYQRTSTHWTPRVMAATNPVWWDGDGNGTFQSPQAYAKQLLAHHEESPDELLAALLDYDEAVAAQVAGNWKETRNQAPDAELQKRLNHAPDFVQRGFSRYEAARLAHLPSTP